MAAGGTEFFVFDQAGAGSTSIIPDTARGAALQRLYQLGGRVYDCLDHNRNQVAERNSCRGPWSQSLDLRASWTPRARR